MWRGGVRAVGGLVGQRRGAGRGREGVLRARLCSSQSQSQSQERSQGRGQERREGRGRRAVDSSWSARRRQHPSEALARFVATPHVKQESANEMVERHVAELQMVQLVDLLHANSKQKRVAITRKNILKIKNRIESLGEAASLRGPQIGKALFAMRQFSSDDYAARLLLVEFTRKIVENEEILSSQTVANMIYGMSGMDATHWEVRQYLKVLSDKILVSHQKMKYFEVSSAMYGLRRMDSMYLEVQDVIAVLARKIESSRDAFNSQVISNCLYGMQNMSSRHEAVRYLVSVIRHKIEISDIQEGECMNAQAVGNSLYGLRGMSSERSVVRRLLLALCPKIQSCIQLLTAQAVGNALYGLRFMNSDHEEVRQLLAILAPKIRSSVQVLSVQNIDNAFFGLQRMSSDHHEVRAIVDALGSKLGSRQLDSHAFGSVFFGLQRMKCCHEEVRNLLTVLTLALPKPELFSTCGSEDRYYASSYAMAFSGLRQMKSTTVEVDALLTKIHELINTCAETFMISSLVNILFGLQSMTVNDSASVRNILAFVWLQLGTYHLDDQKFSELDGHNELTNSRLGRALYGLHSMSSDVEEVRRIISAVAIILNKDKSVQHELSSLDLKRIVGGMCGMNSDHQEVRELLSAVTNRLSLSSVSDTSDASESIGDIIEDYKGCALLKMNCEEVLTFSNTLTMLHSTTDSSSKTSM